MTGESTPPLRSVSEPKRPSDTDRMDDRAKRIHSANAPLEESEDPASADPKASSNPSAPQAEPNPKSDAEATQD